MKGLPANFESKNFNLRYLVETVRDTNGYITLKLVPDSLAKVPVFDAILEQYQNWDPNLWNYFLSGVRWNFEFFGVNPPNLFDESLFEKEWKAMIKVLRYFGVKKILMTENVGHDLPKVTLEKLGFEVEVSKVVKL